MENGVTGAHGEKVEVVLEQGYCVQGVKEYTGQEHASDQHMEGVLVLVLLNNGPLEHASRHTLKVRLNP